MVKILKILSRVLAFHRVPVGERRDAGHRRQLLPHPVAQRHPLAGGGHAILLPGHHLVRLGLMEPNYNRTRQRVAVKVVENSSILTT